MRQSRLVQRLLDQLLMQISNVQDYCDGCGSDQLSRSTLRRDAVERSLIRIQCISQELQNQDFDLYRKIRHALRLMDGCDFANSLDRTDGNVLWALTLYCRDTLGPAIVRVR